MPRVHLIIDKPQWQSARQRMLESWHRARRLVFHHNEHAEIVWAKISDYEELSPQLSRIEQPRPPPVYSPSRGTHRR